MHWKIKAGIQKVLSYTRLGDRFNHIPATLQKHYYENVFNYQLHECIRKLKETKPFLEGKEKIALEIGTGYSIVSPVILFLLGFKKIVTVDISNDISMNTAKKQLCFFRNQAYKAIVMKNSIYEEGELEEKINTLLSFTSMNKLLDYCRITYLPKYTFDDIDALNYKFDYIYSQVVFEHIDKKTLEALFKKMEKWLSNDGYGVHTINFIDHFANPGFFQDRSISEFNFLRYSDKFWNFWTRNPIAFTNRLTFPFYLDLCEEVGLDVVSFKGKNYREHKPLDNSLIHKDVLDKYKNTVRIEDLQKYQRGTLVFRSKP
ncbi:hypothetical protein [Tenacibaculum xiamenense]|uniref:hypothetical protein n=1 Tax=Tenacibaculum xiamenense TaxID=1261553 RepID=UPI00389602DB